MTGAAVIRATIVANIRTLDAYGELESYGVHGLFADLYARISRLLLEHADSLPQPAFCYLVHARFFDLYEGYVARPVVEGCGIAAAHWRRYAALADRLTLDSSPEALRRLLALGARAHIRHDLGEAIVLAVGDHWRLFGCGPDLAAARSELLGEASGHAFFQATMAFNATYRRRERGWRRLIITAHAVVARLTRHLMVEVLQSWRRAAWNDAMAELDELRATSSSRHDADLFLDRNPVELGLDPGEVGVA